MMKKVAIIGAGPSGVLLAHYLLSRGDKYQIDLYERRSDPRLVSFEKTRTFPISLGSRGMNALAQIPGLEAAVKAISLETSGAVLHQSNGKARVTKRAKPLTTLERTKLTQVLLDELIKNYDNSRLNLHFNCQVADVDFANKQAKLQKIDADKYTDVETEFTINYDLLIAADGARSTVREKLLNVDKFACEQTYITNGYKSIFLPNPTEKPGINLQKGKIHTWRLDGSVNVLILYLVDGTMSGVLIFPYENNPIAELTNSDTVLKFFREKCPEIGQLMPESEAEDFAQRPISRVTTVRCDRYHQGDSVLIIGDAAHAVSPAIGQGCNSALEDVLVFNQLLDEYDDNLALALEQYTIRRQPDAFAVRELSDYTFPLDKKLFLEFIMRESLAKFLHKLFPKYFIPSLFDSVFEANIAYQQILRNYQGWIEKVKKSNTQFLNNQ